jgi:hypothetical protein
VGLDDCRPECDVGFEAFKASNDLKQLVRIKKRHADLQRRL